MKVKELIEALEEMPQDADIEIAAYGMDNELWSHIVIHGRNNMKVYINEWDGSVCIYAEEESLEDE